MKTQSLNGIWQYRIGKGAFNEKNVPFSCLAVGHSECERAFDSEYKSDRIFLKLEGITYLARVFLNGEMLGEMLPYSEYSFDVTQLIKEHDNLLHVELEDTEPKFGPTEGWENFGGIIRNVSLEYKAESFIEDVFFKTELCDDYKNAVICVETKSSACENVTFEISLYDGEALLCRYTQKAEAKRIKLENITPWSPDNPKLYELRVELLSEDREVLDTYVAKVGFKELKCSRHRFVLNGRELYLKGICKHEAVGDSGHCPDYAEIYSDLKMIKDMGCNFVRLVHYPHNKLTLEIADSIGLMVSEEPGLWWSDTSNPKVSEGSLEVLKRTILRDRNHVSVAFWLCFNECRFTEKFLIDSARVCRKYDPTRLVSGANCMSNEDTLVYYNKCGFDFYTMHPYAPTTDRAKKSAAVLNDKPLLFTEWGGFYVYNNPHLLYDFMRDMYGLYEKNSDDGALAGAFLWFFAELNDYNRGQPACTDGMLHEGIVDKYRKPTLIYDAFCKGLRLGEEKDNSACFEFVNEDDTLDLSAMTQLSLSGDCKSDGFEAYFQRAKTEIAEEEQARRAMRPRVLKNGPVLENVSFLYDVPMVACRDNTLVFDCQKQTKCMVITGLTTLDKAYPLGGGYGEEFGKAVITYDDGECHEQPLRNGIEITTAFALRGSSRINPTAEKAKRHAVFSYDKNFEQYIINCLEIELDGKRNAKSVEISAVEGKSILVYGVFAE